jgi:hypothetical protein
MTQDMRAEYSPFTSIENFCDAHASFSVGAIRWLIFNKREELIQKGIIRYWGKKILINPNNFFAYVMEGGTQNLVA